MAWHDRMTDEEIEFIKAAFPQLSTAEIAERLGRSKRTVNKYVADLGLRAPRARACCPPKDPQEAGGTGRRADELRWLAQTLRAALLEEQDRRNIPKLSAEYRATLAELERAEAGGEGAGNQIAELLASVTLSRP